MTGLGKTSWVDKALAKVLDRIAEEVHSDFAPLRVEGAKRLAFREYGCGHYGCTLPTRTDGVVLKVTSDEDEAWFVARALATAEQPAGLVKYHAIRELAGAHRGRKTYAIWREEATSVGGFPSYMHATKDAYHRSSLKEGADLLGDVLAAGRVIRETSHRCATPAVWFEKLQEAAAFEAEAYDHAAAATSRTVVQRLQALRGGLRLATALAIFEMQSEMTVHTNGLAHVGDAFHGWFDEGIVLCDVHLGNIGVPLEMPSADVWNSWIITDPGHAVPLRADLLRVEIKEL